MKKEIDSKEIGGNQSTNTDAISELQQKLDEITSGWQRTQADFINFKKQVAEERVKFCKTANANLLYEILPILDNFQLAAKHIPGELQNNNWVAGVKQIEKQLENTLFSIGLEKIECKEQRFNPVFHEAIEQVESELPEGEIVEETQSGYLFDGEVIRPAKVKISKGKAK